jgi:uncharacterized membrane protein
MNHHKLFVCMCVSLYYNKNILNQIFCEYYMQVFQTTTHYYYFT